MKDVSQKLENLKKYYGKTLQSKNDLKTGTCTCDDPTLASYIRAIEKKIDDEILTRVYGCGSPIPSAVNGCVVLDLGCGAGRDVYVVSSLVGPEGFVIGVDMTREQLEIARRHLNDQMTRFGYERPNVEFKMGMIEDLEGIGIEDSSVDVVISNCVINLSGGKREVFSEIFRILKPGGELYFSDVFAGRRVPEQFAHDPVLHGECLGGAMYVGDFRRLLSELGCRDFRIVKSSKISPNNPEIEAEIGTIDFYSMTVRAFKLDSLEDGCEDYGQIAVYRGTIPGYPQVFELDRDHRFISGKPALVCGNTASMLSETRYAGHFEITGDRTVHYGPFDCAENYVRHEGPGGGSKFC